MVAKGVSIRPDQVGALKPENFFCFLVQET